MWAAQSQEAVPGSVEPALQETTHRGQRSSVRPLSLYDTSLVLGHTAWQDEVARHLSIICSASFTMKSLKLGVAPVALPTRDCQPTKIVLQRVKCIVPFEKSSPLYFVYPRQMNCRCVFRPWRRWG